jgi:glucokinase
MSTSEKRLWSTPNAQRVENRMRMKSSVLVYDVGGNHVSAAVCRLDSYGLGRVISAPHPINPTSDAFINLLHSVGIQAMSGFNQILGANLAFPGPFDYSDGVSQMTHKIPCLFGVNLRQELAQRFEWNPVQVRFLNDAAAYLLGELGSGSARGMNRAIAITLGTGIGSAFSVDGQVIVEGRGVPPGGEIWNLPYKDGIVEDVISACAIQKSFMLRTRRKLKAIDIAAAAANDPIAVEVFREFGHELGRVLRRTLSLFSPDVVVFGGGISGAADLFLAATECEVRDLNIPLRVSALQDSAPLVGAGFAWPKRFRIPERRG